VKGGIKPKLKDTVIPKSGKVQLQRHSIAPREARNIKHSQQFVLGNQPRLSDHEDQNDCTRYCLRLSSTFALAQSSGGSAGGSSSSAGRPQARRRRAVPWADGRTTGGNSSGGGAIQNDATGANMGSGSTPSAGNPSNSGAPTAGSSEKMGNSATPGGVQKTKA
jgi:hypothetical protein